MYLLLLLNWVILFTLIQVKKAHLNGYKDFKCLLLQVIIITLFKVELYYIKLLFFSPDLPFAFQFLD